VASGVKLVAESESSFKQILDRVEGLVSSIDNITNGARSQSTALAEVAASMNELDKATQQNSSMVAETTGSIQQLEVKSNRLLD
jgi:methyl-accepting chemotaxis protein